MVLQGSKYVAPIGSNREYGMQPLNRGCWRTEPNLFFKHMLDTWEGGWDRLDTWEGGWDSGSSCWTLGRGAGIVDEEVLSSWLEQHARSARVLLENGFKYFYFHPDSSGNDPTGLIFFQLG